MRIQQALIIAFGLSCFAVYAADAKSTDSAVDKTVKAVKKEWKAPAKKPKPVSPWKGTNAQGGGVINTGNTDSQSYNFGGLLQYAYKKWLFKENTTYQRTSARPNGTTADKFYTMARADYSLSDHNFLYGSSDYTRDMFNGYVYVVNINVGYGRRLHVPKNMTLDVFAGPGVRLDELDTTHEKRTLASLQFGATYEWQITQNTQLQEQLQTNIARDNTHSFSKTALITSLTDKLSFSVSYLIENDSQPAPGKEHINTITEFNLIYNFV